jgi:hypothetical protein
MGPTGRYVGVTGTPVIDTTNPNDPILYVVGAVHLVSLTSTTAYYLFAVDIVSHSVQFTPITATVNGFAPGPGGKCTSTYPHSGTINFDANHVQRSALLLLPVGGVNTVYVAFAPYPETNHNGWMFGYTFNGTSFYQAAVFNSTPFGTGGGFWGSGTGPASDGNYIFATTGNGTLFDPNGPSGIPLDIGDSLVKLTPSLSVHDYYAPYDALNYSQGTGLCTNDEDFGSGGVLLIPATFTYGGLPVVVNADKQSNLYFSYQGNLGKFVSGTVCGSGANNIQCITTPAPPSNDKVQGYWSSPAYWFDGTHSWLYYSATMNGSALFCSGTTLCQNGFGPPMVSPEAINAYQLQPSGGLGPISSATPSASTSTLFCDYSPTPSVSSNGTTKPESGIVWAIEQNQNVDNQSHPTDCFGSHPMGNPGALHAFSASNVATELYSSRTVRTVIQSAQGFVTPTVFNGQVYVGANSEVEVFGLCKNGQNGQCLN